MTHAPARGTTYQHDEAGNIPRIVDPLGSVTRQTFDALGRLASRALPNGVTSTWTYDARGWVDTIVHREPAIEGGDVIASVDYTRSVSGEPERIDREDGSYVLYEYDGSLRLTHEYHRSSAGEITQNLTYVYDADGNRTHRVVQTGPGTTPVDEEYAYGAGDELETITVSGSSTVDYDYDTAGRVTSIADTTRTRALTWDADDHVTAITEGPRTTTWAFDGEGRRVSRTEEVSGLVDREVGYVIAPTLSESLESPHAVTDGSGNEQLGYVFAGEHPLFRYDPVTGEPTYYLQDGMGSVIGLVGDDVATEQSTIHYDAFGNEREVTGSLTALPSASAGDFRFQGMWLDSGTGLYYVRARVYQAGTGRFLSRDPAEGVRRESETYWAYVFAAARPTDARDPSGLVAEASMSGVMAAVAAAAILTATAIAYGPGRNLGLELPGLPNLDPREIDLRGALILAMSVEIARRYAQANTEILRRLFQRSRGWSQCHAVDPANQQLQSGGLAFLLYYCSPRGPGASWGRILLFAADASVGSLRQLPLPRRQRRLGFRSDLPR